jgi:hypothetical protein
MEALMGDESWDAALKRRVKSAEAARLETEVDTLREKLTSEAQDRRLRHPIAIGALLVMVLQVAASNAIFVWYGDANAWDISATAISAWMGTTVVEVVAVVLVIMNYLFPGARGEPG